jgi:hypothetical protein
MLEIGPQITWSTKNFNMNLEHPKNMNIYTHSLKTWTWT